MSGKLINVGLQLACVICSCDSGGFAADPGKTPTNLVFTAQPRSTFARAELNPISVTVQDADGNTAAAASANITLAIGTNPAGATLSGTATVAPISGVATFSNLSLDKSGIGYTLTAHAAGVADAASDFFDVIEPVASVTITPAQASVNAGAPLQLTATTLDAAGNVLRGRTVTWTTSDSRTVYLMNKSNVGVTEFVCGLAPGSWEITASSEGRKGAAVVTVAGSSTVGCCYAGC